MNIFEIASRNAFRYASTKGDITTEQLWSLPLIASNCFDLNNVAIGVNQTLKSLAEESFVSVKTTPGKAELETKMEIIKYIISVKQEAKAAAEKAAENKILRDKLVNALANKEDQDLASLSQEDIRAKLAALA